MSAILSWLHLSDFHVGKDNYGQRQLFDQLIAHVERRLTDADSVDLVVLTGDLANHGRAEEYANFSDRLLLPLIEIMGPRCQLYAVPGNHDVDRSQSRIVQFGGILSRSPALLDPSSEGLNDRSTLLPRFRNYITGDLTNASKNHWLESEAACFTDQFAANGHQVCVVGLNTAWLCHGNDDRHCLSPGKPIIEEALKTARKAELKLVIGHHPVDWFLDDEIEPIGALFAREGVTYLHGHLHRSRSKFENLWPWHVSWYSSRSGVSGQRE